MVILAVSWPGHGPAKSAALGNGLPMREALSGGFSAGP